ncbi:MAG TPA: menaquinone biosynthesis protein [Planctomycetota bacterium]|nr:menaquinone biosynthesis protein [Planctomycetota bacterium]
MTRPLRLGCVPYLNAKPLLEGLRGVELRPPSRLVGRLASGALDAALIPAVEVLRLGLAHVPGIAIAARGAVQSVRLHHRRPIRELRVVALDRNSRTSNMLTRVLLEERFGLRPRYVVRDPSRGLDWDGVDGAVTIGDTSFLPSGTASKDLAELWSRWTGKPFVFALWAHRPGHPRAAEIARTLREAKRRGRAGLEAIVAREAGRMGLRPAFVRRYLTKAIRYDLGPEERAGLKLFWNYAVDRA